MFAGIVERVCSVTRISAGSTARLEIELGDLLDGLALGASIAINGACLTLAGRQGGVGAFEVVPETLRLTNLGELRAGDAVNVECSLRLGDRIDGHFVQGHIDGQGVVQRNGRDGGDWTLEIATPAALRPYIVRKGSIAIDGTSLTIASVTDDRFRVALIPTTLERTTLGRRRPGERVNLESDVIARLVVSCLEMLTAGGEPTSILPVGGAGSNRQLTIERLKEAGFAS